MRINVKNKIVIWGNDNFNPLGLFRQLGTCGLDILFLINGKVRNCAVKSKYCKKYIVVNDLQEGLEYLLLNYKKEKLKSVLINTSDLIAEFIDQHRSEFEPYFYVTGTIQQGLLTKVDNKTFMTGLAAKLGFLVPSSIECRWNSSLKGITYPCILKPSHSTLGQYNEFKFKICNKESELRRVLKYVRRNSSFLLQQYIPKEKEVLVYGCRMMDGNVIVPGVFIKDRWSDDGAGSHGILSPDIPQSIKIDHIKHFLENIDYYGLFSFEYGLYQDQAYFFEVNLRNDGTSHYFYQAGANIPLAWIYSVVGLDYHDIKTGISFNQYYIDELFDVGRVKGNKIPKCQWNKERQEATICKYYDENDVEPWKAMKKVRYKKLFWDSIMAKYRLFIVYLLDKLN